MIRTVTLNTGFDESYMVTAVDYGGVNDVINYKSEPSGKGINTARAIRALGTPVCAYGLVGSIDENLFSMHLANEGISSSLVTVSGYTRRNLTLSSVADTAPAAHFRASGFSLSDDSAIEELLTRLVQECTEGDILSLHGSTPGGLSPATWSRFANIAYEKKMPLVVDVYGEPLIHLLARDGISLCKPNEDEITVLPGVNSHEIKVNARAALRFMLDCGVRLPTVSLGPKGIWHVFEGRVWSATTRIEHAKVLVGAGDACLAGMLIELANPESSHQQIIARGAAVAGAHIEGYTGKKFALRSHDLLSEVVFTDLGPVM